MKKLSSFEKGVLDYVRQNFVGNLHALIDALEGRCPDDEDDPEGAEEFKAGFDFARKCAETDPSSEVRHEIRQRVGASQHKM